MKSVKLFAFLTILALLCASVVPAQEQTIG